MTKVYPEHIYEPIRREVANSYVRHELRKYLPSVKDEQVWKLIDGDIENWFENCGALFPVRDYWNGVHGIMMGFKLYNQLLAFITARNCQWSREKIKIAEITFTDFGEYKANYVSEEPIIVTEKMVDGKLKLVVYDGNNRVNQAVKRGEIEIEAFVSRFAYETKPVDYWVPTSVLMEVGEYVKRAYKSQETANYEACLGVLKQMCADSETAKYELKERVFGGEGEREKKIRNDLGQSLD